MYEQAAKMNYAAAGTAGGYAGGDALGQPAPRSSQINESASRLANLTDELTQIAGHLGERFNGVLRPCPPTPANPTTTGAREVKAPVADALETIAYRVQRVNLMLQDLLNRCEL